MCELFKTPITNPPDLSKQDSEETSKIIENERSVLGTEEPACIVHNKRKEKFRFKLR
jgi:hypothetical protein